MSRAQESRRGNRTRFKRYFQASRQFFSAADPVRLEILQYLQVRGEACVSDLAAELDMNIAAVSHHLRLLQECRCLKAIRTGRKICYQFMPNSFTKLVTGYLSQGRL